MKKALMNSSSAIAILGAMGIVAPAAARHSTGQAPMLVYMLQVSMPTWMAYFRA